MRTIQDPYTLGHARQALFSQVYLASRAVPPELMPELMQVILAHVTVVAGAPVLGVAAVPLRDVTATLRQAFPTLGPEVQRLLAAIYPVWQATRYAWSRMTDRQRAAVASRFRQQVPPRPPAPHGPDAAPGPVNLFSSLQTAQTFSSLLDTAASFTPCRVCSPGINPFK